MPVEHRAEAAGTRGVLRRAGIEQDAVGDRRIAGQRRRDRPRFRPRSPSSPASPNFCLMSRSRATVSLPCNCRISGCSASTILASVASSASTVSATLTARPLACLPSSRAVSRLRCRGEGGKNTNPTMSAPASQRDVERLARGQAANFDDQGHGSGHGLGRRQGRNRRIRSGAGSTTSRPACLARQPHTAARRRGAEGAADRRARSAAPARRSASWARACRASASCWRAARRQWRCRNQVAEPPATTPRIATAMMTTNSGSLTATDGSARIERIERHRHQMTVGDREHDEDQAQRNQDQSREEFSHDHLSR